MRIYNYAAFARVFELGVTKPNMTKIAKALFEPIISLDGVVNRVGNPYVIDPKCAKTWSEQSADIPENIKEAAMRSDLIEHIEGYFDDNIIDEVVSQTKSYAMYSELLKLIKDSDLDQKLQEELLNIYDSGDLPDFLGKAFLYSLNGAQRYRGNFEHLHTSWSGGCRR